MPTLEISQGIKFHITIDEIIKIIHLIKEQSKQQKARLALKQMLTELKKANKALVNHIYTPLYKIQSKEDFIKKFPRVRIKFKKLLTGERPVFTKISCYKVARKLEALKASQQWKKHVPIIKRDFILLELLVNAWTANDSILYEADGKLINEIKAFMDSLEELAEKKPAIAYNKYKAALKNIEEQYLGLRDNLAELEILSDQF
jgi:hypothetical protein